MVFLFCATARAEVNPVNCRRSVVHPKQNAIYRASEACAWRYPVRVTKTNTHINTNIALAMLQNEGNILFEALYCQFSLVFCILLFLLQLFVEFCCILLDYGINNRPNYKIPKNKNT